MISESRSRPLHASFGILTIEVKFKLYYLQHHNCFIATQIIIILLDFISREFQIIYIIVHTSKQLIEIESELDAQLTKGARYVQISLKQTSHLQNFLNL